MSFQVMKGGQRESYIDGLTRNDLLVEASRHHGCEDFRTASASREPLSVAYRVCHGGEVVPNAISEN